MNEYLMTIVSMCGWIPYWVPTHSFSSHVVLGTSDGTDCYDNLDFDMYVNYGDHANMDDYYGDVWYVIFVYYVKDHESLVFAFL